LLDFLPKYLLKFWLKFGVFLIVFTIIRIIFYSFNAIHFPEVSITDFLAGILFDGVATAIIFLPLVVFELFPNIWRNQKYYQWLLKILFFVLLFFSSLLNLIDIEYFKFTGTRSNSSTLTILSYGNDLQQQLPSFIKDYWFIFLIQIIIIFIALFLYKKINTIKDDSKQTSWLKQIIIFPITVGLIILMGRGTGLRPIEPINITSYTSAQNVPLVLNSAFNVIKTWGKSSLEEKSYYDPKELKAIFNPIKQYDSVAELTQPNIVIIMLESFSVEYIAGINGTKTVNTPFLDSLINESLVFTNCYANGKKSIDAVPSIISSIPKLMTQEFITSAYATNKIESLPKHLNQLGYETSFFHGASNGSMNFDQFANKVEFDNYYGRTEYNNEADFDGTWGIYDEEFFLWSAQKMTDAKKPFFSTIFSLSSHPPYTIPEKYKDKFKGGETKMHNSVKYTDYALKQFFEFAETQDWYDNTLFIITADHTPASGDPIYLTSRGNMHIPLIFFHPTNSNLKGKVTKVAGQIDIMPSIFDLIGYDKPFYAFGNSLFDQSENYSMSLMGSKYLIFGQDFHMTFVNDTPLGLYQLSNLYLKPNELGENPDIAKNLEAKIKAYIQTYHQDLIHNKMIVE